ncbi:MAG: hypothetical protein A2087_10930 [Spirochaetes bacterium GWD1_61_31]|nr:MAG: hypothetical protein A2Y37_06905 [Spirochaetes bacterium GWB1_60_80]OHD30803.1 MAG: hypothetical protein A2004_04430 [Spirochaetes bacterium GWC1_61_12]OHD36406.1 MAG: hypothetical protein A2087_10930 [Spirochaetes bacterium GWD1_61_31]OHD46303.1 MAG: hypothetical protein A2Y35_07180 [Spirochaetes bacterium GWE1_60_18]OHD60910.1 MAG: hypothetical protein A2Y32_11925 [Spirochaetes bacterium GWF1_60_12]HAP42832.1 hypothetical protein [Spirochaetaceae bacterium]
MHEDESRILTTDAGAPVADNQNIITAGKRSPALLQDVWLLKKLAHFHREVIPERRMHAKGSGAYGRFTVTHNITEFSKADIFSKLGKQTEVFARFSIVAGERGAADAERDSRGIALKFYTGQGNWDLVGNNTPVFFIRDPLKFPDLNHAIRRDSRSNLRSRSCTTTKCISRSRWGSRTWRCLGSTSAALIISPADLGRQTRLAGC